MRTPQKPGSQPKAGVQRRSRQEGAGGTAGRAGAEPRLESQERGTESGVDDQDGEPGRGPYGALPAGYAAFSPLQTSLLLPACQEVWERVLLLQGQQPAPQGEGAPTA